MNIYTKNGDKGITSLAHTKNVSKSDDRIQLVGTIEELTSHLGLVKTMVTDSDTIRFLEKIQANLILVMSGVADPYSKDFKINDDKTELLEEEIDRLSKLFQQPRDFVIPGKCRLSAEMDIARTVARRAERDLASVSVKFGSDNGAKKYMNRLADYLYMLARYTDAQEAGKPAQAACPAAVEPVKVPEAVIVPDEKSTVSAAEPEQKTVISSMIPAGGSRAMETEQKPGLNETVVREVLKRMGIPTRITLESAKRLIEKIEAEAERRGKKAVIAVCGPEGNPIAVHVMDGAFLVSFDVATKKAYTAVAVKMSTKELSVLAQPGGTFYGVDKMDGGKIVIFGGGVPLKVGDTIIGGLGISGGTGEEDHSLAEYGLSVLNEIL